MRFIAPLSRATTSTAFFRRISKRTRPRKIWRQFGREGKTVAPCA
jgi:hypothetical protein